MNPYRLFLELMLGLIGMGYFIYGKKRGNMVCLVCGLGLGLFPYFVENITAIWFLGLSCCLIPFVYKWN